MFHAQRGGNLRLLGRRGCQTFDFVRGPGPDPEVWTYCEGDPLPAPRWPRFTDWLTYHVDYQTEAWRRLVPRYQEEHAKGGLTIARINPDGSRTEGI